MSQQLEYQVEAIPTNGIPTQQPQATAGTLRAEGAEATIQASRVWHRTHTRARRPWPWRVGVAGLMVVTVAMLLWQSYRPQVVSVIQPTLTTITESLSTTGRVSGTMETLVGAQASGIMDRLFVREGDRVTAGQQLAVLKNNVAEAQVAQAQAALNTVRAQLPRSPAHRYTPISKRRLNRSDRPAPNWPNSTPPWPKPNTPWPKRVPNSANLRRTGSHRQAIRTQCTTRSAGFYRPDGV